MKKIRYIFLVIFFISCAYAPVPNYLKKRISGYHGISYTGIDTIINIQGVFTEIQKENYGLRGKSYMCINTYKLKEECKLSLLFLNGGICHVFFHDSKFPIADFKEKCATGGVNGYIGYYKIDNDTIKIKVINHPSFLSPTWMAYEEWYKIINQNTLQLVAHRQLDIDSQEKDYYYPIEIVDTTKISAARFESLETIPYSEYSWLLKQKWFWCNESEYKQWKKQQKVKTKSK